MNKNINYLVKDFNNYKNKLISFAKSYYPNIYTDFSNNSLGMMFIEMSAYVGDVLSFYLDNQIQENYLEFSKNKKNLLNQAYVFGYFPKITTPSFTKLSIYQLLPSINISGSYYPDFNYSFIINENMQVQSNNNINFYVTDKIDFSISSSIDNTDIEIYSLDTNGNPEYYLLKKQKDIYSAEIKTQIFPIGESTNFLTIDLYDDRIIKIEEIIDSNQNKWYEVPYLSHDYVIKNTPIEETKFRNINSNINILEFIKTDNRFITRFKNNNLLQIQFGANTTNEIINENDSLYNFNLNGLPYSKNTYNPINPYNINNSYGISPSNTTLNIKYLTGGGLQSNVESNSITKIISSDSYLKNPTQQEIESIILNSLTINNEFPSIGGGDGDSILDLKNNISKSNNSQLRVVTKDDYIIRTLSLPSKYGVISKSYVDVNINNNIDIYILTYDINKNLEYCNDIIKHNLYHYLKQFTILDTKINILNPYIINIGIDFDIIVRNNYNTSLVIKECIITIQEYFSNNNIQINSPIILDELYSKLDLVDGVQTVKNINIFNKNNEINGYSKYSYDIKLATINNIIYPSLDPCIFEIKYPNIDIQGKSI